MITYVVLVGFEDVTRGSQTFYGVPALVDLRVALIASLIAILIARLFRDSVPGLRLRASREDELASRSMGVNVANLRLTSWLLSALVVGVAGALLGFTLTAFSPKQFYFTLQFVLVAMLVVGSPSTVTGAVGGAFLVSLLMEAARRVESAMNGQVFGLQELALGVAILAVLYWRRGGLFGLAEADEFLAERLRSRATPRAGKVPSGPPIGSPPQALEGPEPVSTGADATGLGSNGGQGQET
jgi:branched-chain amino acid transport system permease protein